MAQDDDSFGLPDLNYKPLEPKPQTPPPSPPKVEKRQETSYSSTRIQTPGTPGRTISKTEEDEGTSSTKVIVGILVPILILVGGYFAYKYLYKIPKEKAAIEDARKKDIADKKAKEEAARLAKLKAEEEANRLAEEARNAKPAIGTMETLSARTGRYYVIVSSSVDGDLAMDLAKKLSVKGVSTKIIPPFGKWKYFRLTISDHDTFELAQTSADEAKAEYGSGLWVMKY